MFHNETITIESQTLETHQIKNGQHILTIAPFIIWPLPPGSATLHAWQQLAQPHLGGLLDHRPGVLTKGFRTLEQDRQQPDGSSSDWQLDQPEEDEVSLSSFTGLSKEEELPWLSSTPVYGHAHPRTMNNGICIRQIGGGGDNDVDDSLLETLRGVRGGGALRGEKEGPSVDGPSNTSCSSLSCPAPGVTATTPSADEPKGVGGLGDFRELQALQAGVVDGLPGEGVSYGGVVAAS